MNAARTFSRLVGAVLGFATLIAPVTSRAPHESGVARLGVILPASPGSTYEAFRRGLGELGYIEGRNIVTELRYTEGQLDRLPGLAAELVRLNVDVIALVGAVTARAAKKESTTIPIVFAVVVDPVADGVVSDLRHPGGNVTGVTSFDPQQASEQLKILRESIPGVTRVAILGDAGVSEALMNSNRSAAQAQGLQPQAYRIKGSAADLEGAFDAMTRDHADALVVLEEPVTVEYRKRIAELAAASRLPTLFALDRADAGGLIAYGTSVQDAAHQAASLVDRILKGARPGDLSVEQVTRHGLIVNLKTARTIGIVIPSELLKRADRVLE